MCYKNSIKMGYFASKKIDEFNYNKLFELLEEKNFLNNKKFVAFKDNKKHTSYKKNEIKFSDLNYHVFIRQTINNIFVTLTDKYGNTISRSSAGLVGFQGPRKSTYYVSQKVGESIASKIVELGIKIISIVLRSPFTSYVNAVIRGIFTSSSDQISKKFFRVYKVYYWVNLAHNGSRLRKLRRV